jgi:hypothetical protein
METLIPRIYRITYLCLFNIVLRMMNRKMQNFVEVDHHNENCKDGYIFYRPE